MGAFLKVSAQLTVGLCLFLCVSCTPPSERAGLLIAAYTAPREALEEALIPAFKEQWRARTGAELDIRVSYLGSGAQAKSVVSGFPADVVLLALEADVDRVKVAGLLHPDWRQRTGHGGFVARTLVAIAVRTGNPRGIHEWEDLARPGIEVLTPNPRTSGGAMWNVLAVYGGAKKPEDADELVRGVFHNVLVMDSGARESVVKFERGIGDAAITYETEVHAARRAGRKYDYVIPSSTMLVEIPAAVVDRNVDTRGTRASAEAFVSFLATPQAQALWADFGYRSLTSDLSMPGDPRFPPVKSVFRIDRFGGWGAVIPKYFGKDGHLMRLIEEGQTTR